MTEQTIYQWPDYYDWTSEGLDHDQTYYVELAKKCGGPVLELGCGTGRITLAIAREGIPVVGLDREHRMLEFAQKKAEAMQLTHHVRWELADMAQFQLDEQFPLILIPYRAFQHLCTIQEQVACLKLIRQHLQKDGLLAFNLFVPHQDHLQAIDGTYGFRGTYPVPGTEEIIDVSDFTEVDYYTQVIRVLRYYERYDSHGRLQEKLRTQMKFRYTYPSELTHLLCLTGFKVLARYGTFQQSYFHSQSEELIVEAGLNPHVFRRESI